MKRMDRVDISIMDGLMETRASMNCPCMENATKEITGMITKCAEKIFKFTDIKEKIPELKDIGIWLEGNIPFDKWAEVSEKIVKAPPVFMDAGMVYCKIDL